MLLRVIISIQQVHHAKFEMPLLPELRIHWFKACCLDSTSTSIYTKTRHKDKTQRQDTKTRHKDKTQRQSN